MAAAVVAPAQPLPSGILKGLNGFKWLFSSLPLAYSPSLCLVSVAMGSAW